MAETPDLLSELRSLGEQSPEEAQPEPEVGVSRTAIELDREGFFDSLGIKSGLDRATAEANAVTKSAGHLGVMGDWGLLDKDGKADWLKEERATVDQQMPVRKEALGRATEAERIYTEIAPDAPVHPWIRERKAFQQKALEETTKREREVSEIEAGTRPNVAKGLARSSTEQVVQGVSSIASGIVKSVGIGASLAGKATGTYDFAPDDNLAYSLGAYIEAKAKQFFPGEPARQYEFSQKLAHGAGSMIGFYGPAIAGKLAGASDRVLIGIAGTSGALAEGAQTFDEAKEAFDKGASPGWRAERIAEWTGSEPSDAAKFLAFGGGLLLGVTEAAPIAHMLKGGGGVSAALNQMVEEGGQEGVQKFGENLLAKYLHTPGRELGEGVTEAAGIGAILGGNMSLAKTGIDKLRGRTEATEEKPAKVEEKPVSADKKAIDLDKYADEPTPREGGGEGVSSQGLETAPPPASEDLDQADAATRPATGLGQPDAEQVQGESIADAAVKVGGKIYTGRTHLIALEVAANELGVPVEDLFDRKEGDPGFITADDGFVTSTGRYVNREEASRIAEAAEQTKAPVRDRKLFAAEELKSDRPGRAAAGDDPVDRRRETDTDTDTRRIAASMVLKDTRREEDEGGEGGAPAAPGSVYETAEKRSQGTQTEEDVNRALPKDVLDFLRRTNPELAARYEQSDDDDRGSGGAPAAPGAVTDDIPNFDEVRANLPRDENGYPDVIAFRDFLKSSFGKTSWNELTDQEKIEAYQEYEGGRPEGERTAPANRIVTPDGSMEVEARPELVELSDLRLASGDLQPRDRSRSESEAGVRERAANLDPSRLEPSRVSDSGAPIVGSDGTIVSGNGRVMSISEAYRDPALKSRADAYRAALGEEAAGMRQPVLVQRLAQDLSREDLIRFADLSNRPAVAGMSATERAQRDARAAGADLMALYQGGSFTSPANTEFYRAFLNQAVSSAERGTISRNGVLTKEGEDRMSAAVLAAAYGDSDLLARMLESTDDGIRNVTGAMRDAAGAFIRLKAAIAAGEAAPQFDVTPQIVETAKRIADLRERGIKPAEFLAQQDAFTELDPIVESLLRAFYNDNLSRALSREKLTELLTAYAEEASKHQAEGLIPDDTSPIDVVRFARDKATREDALAERFRAAQGDLLASSRPGTDGRADAETGDRAGRRGDIGSRETSRKQSDPETGRSDLSQSFRKILAGKSPKARWARELGISEEELQPLIDRAVSDGLLRVDARGRLMRTPQAKTQVEAAPAARQSEAIPARPDRQGGAEAAEPDRTERAAPSLTIDPSVLLDKAVERRQAATGRSMSPAVRSYAERIQAARGDEEAFTAEMSALKADRSFSKAEALDLAAVVGLPPTSRTTKAQALASIEARHREVIGLRQPKDAAKGIKLASFAGEKAKGAPLSSLNLAQSMLRKGKKPDEVLRATGWFMGPEGKWRFEIDDSAAKLVNLEKHVKAPSNGFFRSVLGMRSKEAPQWSRGKVRVGLNVPLGDILSHDKLFKAYPFLRQMQANIVVGEGVPASREGGSLVYRKGDGGLIYAPIRVRVRSEADVLGVLMHEIQHYIQNKEGFAQGSSTSARKGQFDVKPLNYASTSTDPITAKGESFSPTTIEATTNPMDLASGLDWRSQIAGFTRAEQLALQIEDAYKGLRMAEARDGTPVLLSPETHAYIENRRLVPNRKGDIVTTPEFVRSKLLPHMQAELMNMLRVKLEDYVSSVGEEEANLVMERLGLSDAERKAALPKFAGKPSQIVTTNFREAADALLESARRNQQIRERWAEPVQLGNGVAATRYDENAIAFEAEENEGMRFEINAVLDWSNGRAILSLYPEVWAGAKGVRGPSGKPTPIKRLNEVADEAEKYLRSLNLLPTADSRLLPMDDSPKPLSDKDFDFWHQRDGSFMEDHPRSHRQALQAMAQSRYGKGAVVHTPSDGTVSVSLPKEHGYQVALVTDWVMEIGAESGAVPLDLQTANLDPEVWRARTADHEASDPAAVLAVLVGRIAEIQQRRAQLEADRLTARDRYERGGQDQKTWKAYTDRLTEIDQDDRREYAKIEAIQAEMANGPLRPLYESYWASREQWQQAERDLEAAYQELIDNPAYAKDAARALKGAGAELIKEYIGESVDAFLRDPGDMGNLGYLGLYDYLISVVRKHSSAFRDAEARIESASKASDEAMNRIKSDGGAYYGDRQDLARQSGKGKGIKLAAFTRSGRIPPRSQGIPQPADPPVSSYTRDSDIKAHPDYAAAKTGDREAAARLVPDLVRPETVEEALRRFGPDAIYVPVIAEEAGGRNKIPEMLAYYYAGSTGAAAADDIIQSSRAFHTGARPMERLLKEARALFEGDVVKGGKYVLVDDVSVMGGTLAELADFISVHGGEVAGTVTLVNASRTGLYTPKPAQIREIEARYGDVVRQEFGVEPAALTADEASYILNFRDADRLRESIAKARGERDTRLRAKGLLPSRSEGGEGPVTASLSRPRSLRPQFIERWPQTYFAFLEEVERTLPPEVYVRVQDALSHGDVELLGSFDIVSASIGLEQSGDPRSVFRTFKHERIHALRSLGLFSEQEWGLLLGHAKKVLGEHFTTRDGSGETVVEEYRNFYEPQVAQMGATDGEIEFLTDEFVEQEYVAALAEMHFGGARFPNRISQLLDRILKFFEALSNALRGKGFQTVDDVFESIDSGEVASRPYPARSVRDVVLDILERDASPDLPLASMKDMREGQGSSLPVRLKPEFTVKWPDTLEDVLAELRKMVPPSVVIRLVDEITDAEDASGLYFQKLIQVAVGEASKTDQDNFLEWVREIGKHEVLHALRQLRLFTDKEWRLLVDHARKTTKIEWEDADGQMVDGEAYYRNRYRTELEKGGYDEATIKVTLEDVIDQEYVSNMAETFMSGDVVYPSKIAEILGRILKFFEAIGNALQGNGFQTIEDVFERIASGEVAARPEPMTIDKLEEPLSELQDRMDALRRDLDNDLVESTRAELQEWFDEQGLTFDLSDDDVRLIAEMRTDDLFSIEEALTELDNVRLDEEAAADEVDPGRAALASREGRSALKLFAIRKTLAAIKIDGAIYTGFSHWEAFEKASESLNPDGTDTLAEKAIDGFVTVSDGKFYTRKEASDLLDQTFVDAQTQIIDDLEDAAKSSLRRETTRPFDFEVEGYRGEVVTEDKGDGDRIRVYSVVPEEEVVQALAATRVTTGLGHPDAEQVEALKAEGFDTDEVLYHGMTGKHGDALEVDTTHVVHATWLTPVREEAENWSDVASLQEGAQGSRLVQRAYIRPGRQLVVGPDDLSHTPRLLEKPNKHHDKPAIVFDQKLFDGYLSQAVTFGYDSLRIKDVVDISPIPSDQIIVFKQENVRTLSSYEVDADQDIDTPPPVGQTTALTGDDRSAGRTSPDDRVKPLAIQLVEGESGWEISLPKIPATSRGKGLVHQLIGAIESDLGQSVSPDGWLTEEAYQLYSATDPDKVKHHQNAGPLFENLWVSPKAIEFASVILEEASQKSASPDEVISVIRQAQRMEEMKAAIPGEVEEVREIKLKLAAVKGVPARTGKHGSRVEDAGLRRALGDIYKTAVAGEDYSTQFDVLNGRLNNDRDMPQDMRERMELEVQRVATILGDDWLKKYAPDWYAAHGNVDVGVAPSLKLAAVKKPSLPHAIRLGTRQQNTGKPNLEAPEKGLSELVEDVNEALGLTTRHGRLDPGLKAQAGRQGMRVAGQFGRTTGVTRIATPNDIATLAHEGGHALESRADIKADLDALKKAHVEELTTNPAIDVAPKQLAAGTGFSGVELDADTQRLLSEAVIADRAWRQMGTVAGQAKSGMRTGGVKHTPVAYSAAQEMAARTWGLLVRRVGQKRATAYLDDVRKAVPQGVADAYVKTRFSATGNPAPRAPVTASAEALSEGFAEWFRLNLTNPTEARRRAPAFVLDFEDMIDGADPALLAGLEEIQKGYQELLSASPAGAVRSRVQSTVLPGKLGALREEISDKGLRATISDRMYAFYAGFIDGKHPMKRAVRYLLEMAGENLGLQLGPKERLVLKAMDDPYKLWRLAEHSKVWATNILQNGVRFKGDADATGPSFHDALKEAFGGTRKSEWNEEKAELFGSYLVARRMLAEFARHDSGLIENVPDQLIERRVWLKARKDLEKAYPEFVNAAKLLYRFNKNHLLLKQQAGFLTRDMFLELNSRVDYVPLNRIMDDGGPSQLGKSASGQNKRKLIYRFQGSTRDFINPLESIAQDVYATQGRIALNDIVGAMDRLARAAGPGGGAIAERLPARDMQAITVDVREAIKQAAKDLSPSDAQGLIEIIDDLFDQDASATIFKATDTNEKGEPIVYLWEEGKRVPIRLGDDRIGKDIFEGMVALGQPNTEVWLNVASLGSQIFRAGVTKAPAYILVNFLRDQLATWALSDKFTPFVTGARGLKNAVTDDATAQRYKNFGGMAGVDQNLIDTNAHKRDMLTLRRKGFSSAPTKWQTMMRAMEVTETASRMGHFRAAYDRALADGMTEEEAATEAAYAAHDVLDFSRKGSKMLVVSRLVTFLNATLQGLDAASRTVRGERDSYTNYRDQASPFLSAAAGSPLSVAEKAAIPNSARIWVKLALIGMIGLSLAAIYRDDDEHEELNDYMRATHWFFKVGGVRWRVPKPFELAILSNAFETAFDRYWKQDPRALTRFLESLRYTVSPPAEIQGLTALSRLAELPKAAWESMTGTKDPYAKKGGDNPVPVHQRRLPPEMQFNAYTSELGRMIGKMLNWSPAKVDAFIGDTFATAGRDVMALSDQVLPAINQQLGGALPGVSKTPRADKSVEDYWIVSRFTRRAARSALSSQTFWQQMSQEGGKFIQAAAGYKALLDQGRAAEARDFLGTLKSPEEKAFAILSGHFQEKDVDIHPLHRARQVMSAMSAIRQDMLRESLIKQSTAWDKRHQSREPERIVLSPAKQKTVNEILEDLSMREARNALIVIKQPGWAQKKVMPTEPLLRELRAAAPEVADELEYRLSKGRTKVYPFEGVAKVWPEARDELIREGSDASLSGYRGEARFAN